MAKARQANAEVLDYLKRFQIEPIFNEEILPYLSLYHFEQGEFICTQGEPSPYLYVLVKGKVKIYMTSPEGRTHIRSFKTAPAVIGDIEYVRDVSAINTVEAVSSVCMIGVQYRWLKKYCADDPQLLQFLLKEITNKFYINTNSMSFHLLHPVEVRLASYLLSVSYDETDDQFIGPLSTGSLKDAANFIGTSYRHLNRILQQFCTAGLIERSKGFIHVKDKDGLRAMVSENIYE